MSRTALNNAVFPVTHENLETADALHSSDNK